MGIFDKMKSKSGTKAVVASKPAKKEKAEAKPVAAQAAKAPVKGALAKEDAGRSSYVLIAPVFTEKTAALQSAGKYVFSVARGATKVDVAAAIRDLYGVKPVAVNMMKIQGKNVRFGRFSGKEKDVRKAIVTLKKGDAITLTE